MSAMNASVRARGELRGRLHSVRIRLTGGFGVLIALLVAATWLARSSMDFLSNAIGTTLAEVQADAHLSAQLSSSVVQALEAGHRYVETRDPRALRTFRAHGWSAHRVQRELNSRASQTPTEIALLADIDTKLSAIEVRYALAHRLVELGRTQEAVDFATAQLTSAQRLTDRVVDAVGDPVLAALLLGKAATAHERGVLLEIDPATVVGDTGLPGGDLVTIVGNLLDNAMDAALTGDPPREVQFAAWVDGDRLEIRVEDSGPGVSEEQVPRLFERGWTTKQADGRGPGRGLGLTLVAQAVRRNGGSIDVRPGPGARFAVSLPVRTPVDAIP